MSRIIFRESATPPTGIASGQMFLFADANGDLSWTDDANNVTTLVTAGAATITLPNATDTIAVLGTQQTFTARPIFSTTIGVGGATPSTSGSGITFPVTQSLSTDVNTLDDYEEGPWTPVYQSSGTLPSVIYDPLTIGRYTKIGNIVFIIGAIRTDSVSGGSGQVRIGGLPFVVANLAVLRGTLSLGQIDGFAGEMPYSANMRENTQYANLWYRSSVDGATIALDVSDLGTGADSNFLTFSGHYQV